MSFFKSIKSAFGGSDGEDYDVFGQPTTFVNPFSKDKNLVEREHDQEELQIEVSQQEEYAIDAEYADKAARLMNEHTQAVIDMIKGTWKKEREDLLKVVEDAKKSIEENNEKMKVNEAKPELMTSRLKSPSSRPTTIKSNSKRRASRAASRPWRPVAMAPMSSIRRSRNRMPPLRT